jgi:hypothetical protein
MIWYETQCAASVWRTQPQFHFNLQSLGMLDLYETFHESGVYFQADLVTAYSCVVCKA